MKIAIWHNLPSGGGKRALYYHVQGLLARGHTIEAWCPPTADRDYLPLRELIPEHVVRLTWPPKRRLTDFWQVTLAVQQSLSAMEEHCQQCALEINRRGFDVAFANSCQFFSSAPIGRLVDIPSVFYQGEPRRSLYEAMPRLIWLARPARTGTSIIREWRTTFSDWRAIRNYRLQAREEFNNAAAFTKILVNSRFSRENVIRTYGLDADVCYLGIDTDCFGDRQLQREDFVVGLGSFQPLKNIEFAIRAVAKILAPRPKLVWVGNEVFDPTYLHQMIALAAANDVDFLHQVDLSDDKLVETLNRASMMIYAPRLEPFGLAPLEAAACGVPVVAVPEGGVRETVIDGVTGLYVENEAAAAAALTELRSNPALARRLGSNGRAMVKSRWTLEGATSRIEERLLRYSSATLC